MTVVYSADDLQTAVDSVEPIFQPVLWLDDLSLAGYEALARGPRASPLEMPLDLFAAAKAGGIVGILESAMTKATLDAVMARPWHNSVTLFGNVEPEALPASPTPETLAVIHQAEQLGVRVVIEITERALLANPAALIAASDEARARGWGVAMDDVGASDDTLTLLWVLQPDVVKLDMSILHGPIDDRSDAVCATVRDYCDRTGALMVCEGVESLVHEVRAMDIGADLVQGYRYALPAPRPDSVPEINRPIGLRGVSVGDPLPFVDCVALVDVDTLPGSEVVRMARELLADAEGTTDSAVVLASTPSVGDVPPEFLAALSRFSARAGLVALFAPGVAAEPAPGVVGVDTDVEAVLGAPWSVTVVSPTAASSILAHPFTDDGDGAAPVQHRLLRDRLTVAHGVRMLLSKIISTS